MRRIPFVEDPAQADWLAVRDGERYRLRPTAPGGGFDGAVLAAAEDLLPTLAAVYRVENLNRFALDPRVPRPAEGLWWRSGGSLGRRDPRRGRGGAASRGGVVRIAVRNDTGRLLDLWVFYASADYGLTAVLPRTGHRRRASPSRT